MLPDLINPRHRSLVRANLLVALSFFVALWLSRFPSNHATPLLCLPLLTAVAGTLDTARNMRRRWSWYHGGVVLCIYTDLMVLSMIAFFWLYPYAAWLSGTH